MVQRSKGLAHETIDSKCALKPPYAPVSCSLATRICMVGRDFSDIALVEASRRIVMCPIVFLCLKNIGVYPNITTRGNSWGAMALPTPPNFFPKDFHTPNITTDVEKK